MNNERLIELQNMIYSQNKELGWHDEPRSFNTYVCLFHSELSEAMEGDRKGLMDDHLPQYTMCAVEIADFVIRVLDWFGTKDEINCFVSYEYADWTDSHLINIDFIADMHSVVSNTYESQSSESFLVDTMKLLSLAVEMAFEMAKIGVSNNSWRMIIEYPTQ